MIYSLYLLLFILFLALCYTKDMQEEWRLYVSLVVPVFIPDIIILLNNDGNFIEVYCSM